ncbi:MAG: hypothetical protein JNJ46_06380 [Myxococcales bacterium]|nr:hypothetical protein [Myxococcales bacterium]
MRHIALTGFAQGPCNGLIEMRQLARPPVPEPLLRLPILGASPTSPVTQEWLCTRCGQRWPHEPLPQEAL